jgi:hypothetical protein
VRPPPLPPASPPIAALRHSVESASKTDAIWVAGVRQCEKYVFPALTTVEGTYWASALRSLRAIVRVDPWGRCVLYYAHVRRIIL